MAASLFEHEAIRTTLAKAKEVRPFVERLITLARRGTPHARRVALAMLNDRAMVDKEDAERLADKTVLEKLFDEIAPRYAARPGGYTRIIRLPERRIGDAGRQVLLQLVEESAPAAAAGGTAPAAARRKRAARRAEAALQAGQSAQTKPAESAEPQAEKPADQAPGEQKAQA